MEVRRCKICENRLPADEFNVNHAIPHGIESICKSCQEGWIRKTIYPIMKFAGSYTREEIYDRDQGICYLCGLEVDIYSYEIDEFPIRRQRFDSYLKPDNVAVVHPGCKKQRGDRMPTKEQLRRHKKILTRIEREKEAATPEWL